MIFEGTEINFDRSGWCRIIYRDGKYYVGYTKSDLFHGYGKLASLKGQETGLWDKGKF